MMAENPFKVSSTSNPVIIIGAAITADTLSPHPNISIFPYCQ
jgi:hypothetical protein